MRTMTNPFCQGDVIWFEKYGEPVVMYVVQDPGDIECALYKPSSGDYYSLKEVLEFSSHLSGPYRVKEVENWSGYNFRADEMTKKITFVATSRTPAYLRHLDQDDFDWPPPDGWTPMPVIPSVGWVGWLVGIYGEMLPDYRFEILKPPKRDPWEKAPKWAHELRNEIAEIKNHVIGDGKAHEG